MEEKIIEKDRKIKRLEESNKKLRASLKKLKVFEIKKDYATQNQTIGADQNMKYIKTKIKAALITLNFFLNQFGLNIDLVNIGKIDLMARGEETNAREMNDKRKAPFQIVYTNLTAENHSTEISSCQINLNANLVPKKQSEQMEENTAQDRTLLRFDSPQILE
jgi:hypothetical protein